MTKELSGDRQREPRPDADSRRNVAVVNAQTGKNFQPSWSPAAKIPSGRALKAADKSYHLKRSDSALAGLIAPLHLVDHVDAALAAHDLVGAVA